MRQFAANEAISVHAIAGTHVVLLGLDATPEAARGLLGFTIRKQVGSAEPVALGAGKWFEEDDDEQSPNQLRSDRAPLQTFMWSDYEAEPNETYAYQVIPVYGRPDNLEPRENLAVQVSVTTESVDGATHGVYFNRGVAGSQAYSRRFGKYGRWYLAEHQGKIEPRHFVKPDDVPNDAANEWLSRGLQEALLEFIKQANGPEYSLRAAVYELTYLPAIQALVDAMESGADVKVIHHAKREPTFRLKRNQTSNVKVENHDGTVAKVHKNRELELVAEKDDVCKAAERAIGQIGVKNPDMLKPFSEMFVERVNTEISHNKFVVLLKNGKPIAVWTGSTNFTAGGIFGQTNVGHVVRDTKTAQKYLAYWKQLAKDPTRTEMRAWTIKNTPDLQGAPAPNSVTPIFSPRPESAHTILDWYAEQSNTARQAVFFTAAFSVDARFLKQFTVNVPHDAEQPFQRYILLESRSGKLMGERYRALAKCKQNRIAWGDVMKPRPKLRGSEDSFIETLTGLNDHVQYLHTKFMLVDPLSDDPLVITGSANFSENSTFVNDENMLIIRGDTRVADIFLGEFMRIFNHFRFRNVSNHLDDSEFEKRRFLAADDSWTKPYFTAGRQEQQERLLFRGRRDG